MNTAHHSAHVEAMAEALAGAYQGEGVEQQTVRAASLSADRSGIGHMLAVYVLAELMNRGHSLPPPDRPDKRVWVLPMTFEHNGDGSFTPTVTGLTGLAFSGSTEEVTLELAMLAATSHLEIMLLENGDTNLPAQFTGGVVTVPSIVVVLDAIEKEAIDPATLIDVDRMATMWRANCDQIVAELNHDQVTHEGERLTATEFRTRYHSNAGFRESTQVAWYECLFGTISAALAAQSQEETEPAGEIARSPSGARQARCQQEWTSTGRKTRSKPSSD